MAKTSKAKKANLAQIPPTVTGGAPPETPPPAPAPVAQSEPEPEQKPEPLAALGVTPDAIHKLLGPAIAQSIVEVLNGTGVFAALKSLTEMKQTLEPFLAQIKAAQTAEPPKGEAPAPGGSMLGGLGDLQAIASIIGALKGGGGGGGTGQLQGMFEMMKGFTEVARSMYVEPRMEALNMYSTLFKLGSGAGLEPEKLAAVADRLKAEINAQSKAKPASASA